jgi:hypothetical protein
VLVRLAMAHCAQHNQILGDIIAQLATRLQMVDFKVLQSPTALTPPTIARQNFSPQPEIGIWLKL